MKQLQPSETLPVGLLLALAGGLLDGYSYLNRGQVFATAETGNIVLMGINLAQGQLDQALHYLLPILAFALGVLAAEQLRRRFGDSTRLHWRLPLLLAECGAILLVSCLPCGPLDPLANIIISFTSALQVESFRKFQGCGCVTTMCTGNLRSGTDNLFQYLKTKDKQKLGNAMQYYGIILCFIGGAAVGAFVTELLETKAVFVALTGLVIALCILRSDDDKLAEGK